jgi:hypothetical protein
MKTISWLVIAAAYVVAGMLVAYTAYWAFFLGAGVLGAVLP